MHDWIFFLQWRISILQVQMLEKQVGHLAESQASTDDRYSKVKQENVALNQK